MNMTTGCYTGSKKRHWPGFPTLFTRLSYTSSPGNSVTLKSRLMVRKTQNHLSFQVMSRETSRKLLCVDRRLNHLRMFYHHSQQGHGSHVGSETTIPPSKPVSVLCTSVLPFSVTAEVANLELNILVLIDNGCPDELPSNQTEHKAAPLVTA